MDEIKELGSVTAQTPQGMIQCLTIIGQVEGHQVMPEDTKTTKYEHVMPLLATVEESEEIKGLLILLNTVGGDVEAGLGIAELIAGMKKPTVSLILGGGHSIACSSRKAQLHSPVGSNDDPSRALKRRCHRCAADL